MTRPLVLLTFAFSLGACTPSELEVGSNHAASPRAPTLAPTPVATSLAADFDPLAALAKKPSTSTDPHAEHRHGDPDAPSAEDPHAGHHGSSHDSAEQAPSTPQDQGKKPADVWTCPMHPEIRRGEAGSCPKCGMKLVPEKKQDGGKQ
jgi:hypothetical protein